MSNHTIKLSDMNEDAQGNPVSLQPGPNVKWSVTNTNLASIAQNGDGSEAILMVQAPGQNSIVVTDGIVTAVHPFEEKEKKEKEGKEEKKGKKEKKEKE
jgi:type V secretory pathway adhesin AidA